MARTQFDDEIIALSEKDPGYILSKDVSAAGIEHTYFSDFLIRHPEFVRQERGVYVNQFITEPDTYYILTLHKSVTFSHLTALFLHGIVPMEEKGMSDITLPHAYNKGRMQGNNDGPNMFVENDNIRIFRIYKKDYNRGRVEVNTPYGHKVIAYCPERAVCELISQKSVYGLSNYAKGIKGFFTQDKINLMQLEEFADLFDVKDAVAEYLALFR